MPCFPINIEAVGTAGPLESTASFLASGSCFLPRVVDCVVVFFLFPVIVSGGCWHLLEDASPQF